MAHLKGEIPEALARMYHRKSEKRCEARQSEIHDGSVVAAVPIWDI